MLNYRGNKIGARLGIGFGVVLLLLIGLAVSGYWGVNSIAATTLKFLAGDAKIAEHGARARANVNALRRFEKDVFLNIESQQQVTKYHGQWKEQYEHLKSRISDLEKVATLPQDKDIIRAMKDEIAVYESGFNKTCNAIMEGKIKSPSEANAAMEGVKTAIHNLEKGAKNLAEEGNKRMAGSESLVQSVKSSTMWIVIVFSSISVAFGIGISTLITRSITRPLGKIISGLSAGAEQVASASGQVASAGQSLAEGASEQAAGLEETSSSIEEMTSITRQNAGNAQQADTLMAETSNVVDTANVSMAELTESMKEISSTSEETAKIIKTIDEIAFQTNLLALNAAVEAARAGEAGAGFAVVADEVRNLAMRAADAAKNTANLIEEAVKKIQNGSETVTRTNDAFAKVASGSKKVAELVNEISSASQQQAQGIEQINKAIGEMDKVVQKNAANAEESASAAEEMNVQAEQMKGFVGELLDLVGKNGAGSDMPSIGPLKTGKKPVASGFDISDFTFGGETQRRGPFNRIGRKGNEKGLSAPVGNRTRPQDPPPSDKVGIEGV